MPSIHAVDMVRRYNAHTDLLRSAIAAQEAFSRPTGNYDERLDAMTLLYNAIAKAR